MIWSIDDTCSAISGSYSARSVQRQCDDEGRQQGIEADQDGGFDPVHRHLFLNNPWDDGKKGAGTGALGANACLLPGRDTLNQSQGRVADGPEHNCLLSWNEDSESTQGDARSR